MDLQSAFSPEVSLDDLKRGFTFSAAGPAYVCLLCGERFVQGVVYRGGELLLEAGRAAEHHLRESHGSVFEYLVSLDRKLSGLSDVQKELLELLYRGLSDAEIARKLGKANSTIRNHRFQLRERYREAKLFTALMELLEAGRRDDFVEYPLSLTLRDERAIVTEAEREAILSQHFEDDCRTLIRFPKKEKKKLVILKHIAEMFEPGTMYTESQVNGILQRTYADFATLRRYLIEYGFLSRTPDCSRYWKTDAPVSKP